MSTSQFQLVARTGHPTFLDLPWAEPLEEWRSERLVNLIRGISRHVVRFVEVDGALYALKELPERPARREWTLLRQLESQGLPVEEIKLDSTPEGYRLQLDPHVVEPGHHRHRLLRLTGLDAQENQARRMLNDLARYREALERTQKRTLPESVVASKWRDEVFEPTVAAVPDELWGRLPAAEVFHQVLEHRWFLSEEAGKDVGIDEALRSYVSSELPTRPPERVVLALPTVLDDPQTEAPSIASHRIHTPAARNSYRPFR